LITDIVIGLQHGDEGKGKVTHHLLKSREYTHCVRFNGGCNAGHTIYHDGVKLITHHIPAGVFFGVTSIIGNGCVVDPDKLFQEIEYLESHGINVRDHLKIAKNAHIITELHKAQDGKDERIGTTRTGNGPAYRDKYARSGIRASDIPELSGFIVDIYEELSGDSVILMEGAQGFWLDPDWGDYPYVTSSHTGTAAAIQNGINPRSIRNVWGIIKAYETYVGKRKFQPDDEVFDQIQQVGAEFGATTGRVRQCNWINTREVRQAIDMNGVNRLVVNKMDVLREIDTWGTTERRLHGERHFRKHIADEFSRRLGIEKIYFSDNPRSIHEENPLTAAA
jgi:adenylosuccinate synthase